MDWTIQQGLAVLVAFWASLFLIDQYLKSNRRWSSSYRRFTEDKGITVHSFRVQWYTRSFNSLFYHLGQKKPYFLQKWFDLGVYVTLVCVVFAIGFLITIPVNTLLLSQKAEEQVLKPVIPGVNLPSTDISYYMVTLFISAILHEFGHAIAAVREDVTLNGFGMFIMLLYPGAFVDMRTDNLMSLSPWQRLKVFCAGVWHNIVIVLLGLLILVSLPTLLLPFYSLHNNVVVTSHSPNSVVAGPGGFAIGDIILSVDHCSVSSVADWTGCIINSIESAEIPSYCVPKYLTEAAYTPVISKDGCQCKDEAGHICFSEIPANKFAEKTICLKARDVISNDHCAGCDLDTHKCVRMSTEHMDNSTKLLIVKRKVANPVLFFGDPRSLYASIVLGEVVPKYSYAPLQLPYMLEKISKYFVSLSGALGLLNAVPCFALDGQYIAQALVELIIPSALKERQTLIADSVIGFGTCILFINVLLAMYNALL